MIEVEIIDWKLYINDKRLWIKIKIKDLKSVKDYLDERNKKLEEAKKDNWFK
jgi:hypothetical protein